MTFAEWTLPDGFLAGFHGIFNACEAGLWFIIGAGFLWKSFRLPRPRKLLALLAGLAFLAFGGSDLVEIRTGAWYEPWWLLVWKAACVITLVSCHIVHRGMREPDSAR